MKTLPVAVRRTYAKKTKAWWVGGDRRVENGSPISSADNQDNIGSITNTGNPDGGPAVSDRYT